MSIPGRDIDEGGAGSLVERVRRVDRVREIERSLKGGARRVDVSGLRGTAPAFVVEALRGSLGSTILVCCPGEEKARDVYADLDTISSARVALLPEKDIFPQRFELKENLSVRGKRNACLDDIREGRVDIVVTSLVGFLEKTIPVGKLRKYTRYINVGEELDLESLREHLVDVGYEAMSIIEEPGQFAVRGAIVDLYDPSWDDPVRFELLDDEVISIRAFDIESQRSHVLLESVRILPATGIIVGDEVFDTLKANLNEKGFGAEAIQQIRQDIEDHGFSYLLQRYAPAMGINGTLLDFFPSPPLVFFWDEEGLAREFEKLEEEIEHVGTFVGDTEPLLDLFDYIHSPEYYTSRGIAAIHHWKLAPKGDTAPAGVIEFQMSEHPAVVGKFETLIDTLRSLRKKGTDIHIYAESAIQRERLADMLGEDEALVHLPVGWITSGFVWPSSGFAILTDHEIFHRNLPRPSKKKPARRTQMGRPEHLQVGDFIVHVDYGIGRYLGLEKVAVEGREAECLSLRYYGTDRIYVPLDQMGLIEKYVGKDGVVPAIDRLRSTRWQRTKERTKKALEDVARDLLQVYAEREVAGGLAFNPDGQWQKELEASFPFEETPHQLKAAEEIKLDMESPKPMDRLICGDVGFGKTEVAIRAAFKAVSQGKQVAVLVPTTILALQHYKTFSERVAAFPVNVEMLSRFRSAAEQRKIIEQLGKGQVDVIIGTHRLLSGDIRFHDIGLFIIDEEHRFGVKNKEKMKRIKRTIDVLSLTATPIPRTLYLSLSGLRRISVIDTPPRNRHPVKTEVLPFDEETISQAIRTEVRRGGQVFLVHNRVASIHSMQAFLERLTPEVRFCVAHGQMGEKDLEKIILDFLDKKFDVLVSTTIIESGLDFPNVNTIIINRADRMGLAELYQLRGRVGRRDQQAYAYLLIPRNFSISENASKRLQAMEEFEELGSGYRLAMRDLEIRGAGNVLGVEQHGQIVAVGFDLYCRMLKETVDKIKGEKTGEKPECRIETRLPSFLPDRYVEDQNERMAIYKRLAHLEIPEEADELETEITDRFGEPPVEAVNLIELTRIKLRAMHLGIGLVQFRQGRVVAEFLPDRSFHPHLCAQLVETFEGRVLFKAGGTFGLTLALGSHADLLAEAKKLLQVAYFYDKTYNPPNREHPS